MIVDDPALPAAIHLTGPDGGDVVAAAVAQLGGTLHALAVKGVQYRPGSELVVQYRGDVTWASDVETRRDTLLAAATTGDALPGTLPVTATVDGADMTVSLWRWPFDPMVPGIEDAATPGRLGRLLAGTVGAGAAREVVAYRPTERAVVRVTGERSTVYVKAVRPAEVESLVDRHAQLRGAGLRVPAVLDVDSDAGLVVLEELPGTTLRERIKGQMDVLVAPGEMDRIQREIASVSPDGLPTLAGRISDSIGHGSLLRRIASSARPILDTLSPVLTAALHGVEGRRGPTVHGDLHEGQLIVDDDGRITGLLDIDSLSVGDPLDDVVTVLGHLTYRAMRAEGAPGSLDRLVADLRSAGADRFGAELVDVGTAAVLVGLATGPFRIQAPDWESEVDRILTVAADLVGASVAAAT